MEYYVTSDQTGVKDFATYVTVPGCGNYKITHTWREPIGYAHFSFQGPFRANGTFSSSTRCTGSRTLDNFYIEGCGNVSGGPWGYTATWRHGAAAGEDLTDQPSSAERVSENESRFFLEAKRVSE